MRTPTWSLIFFHTQKVVVDYHLNSVEEAEKIVALFQ